MLGIAGMCAALGLGRDAPGDIVPGLRLPFGSPTRGCAFLAVTVAGLAVSILGGVTHALVPDSARREPRASATLVVGGTDGCLVGAYFVSLPDGGLIYAWIGVAVAVGVLRYGLLDITVVMRRTLLYAPLIGLIALVLAGVSTALSRFAPSGPLPFVAAAGAVAVLIGPVATRLRRAVDRFVLGPRADPVSAVRGIAASGEVADQGDPLLTLLRALVEAVELSFVTVIDASGRPLATIGHEPPRTLRLVLREGGDVLGDLVVAEPGDAVGRRIVDALVPHVASVLRTQRLTVELDEERRRAQDARVAERERIRRDLHDGLGPSLSGISLSLQAASTAMTGDQEVARLILRRARDEADAAVHEVRRVLDGLGPGALDEQELADAIRATAAHLGFDGDRVRRSTAPLGTS